MNQNKLNVSLFVLFLVLLSCGKSDEECKWGYGVLNGKTYKMTGARDNGKDIYDQIDKCSLRPITYQEGDFTVPSDNSCPSSDPVPYNTYTKANGTKYYVEAGVYKFIVIRYDCESITMYAEFNSRIQLDLTRQ